jgi:RimJ/RimL family protein N-acetyltransferase
MKELAKRSIRTKKVSLEDIDYVMTWINDPEVVKNFQNFDRQISKTEELEFLERIIASPVDHLFSLFDAESGAYVGQGGINNIAPKNNLGRLSIFIRKEMQHQGYGRTAVLEILRYAFKDLNLHKVWLVVFEKNQRATTLYYKLGFKQEGILEEEYYWNGRYENLVRMGMLQAHYCELYDQNGP